MMDKNIDIMIRHVKVYDGAGGDPFTGDIGIAGDRIISVSGPRHACNAVGTIEAEGLCACPGFIDAHAHSDFTLFADGRAEGKVSQGVTTEINGNCGLSAAPLYGDASRHRENDLEELGIVERWSTFEEYFAFLEKKGFAVNFATLAGHGNIRASVMGYEDRRPGISELEEMKVLLTDAIGDGALGLSSGLIYPPGVYSTTDELIELCKGDAWTRGSGTMDGGFLYTSHMRSEGDELIKAIKEVTNIGRSAGISVHISHLKTAGKKNWWKIEDAISAIENARGEGVRMTCDRYPYTASSTDLDAVLPSWTYEGGALKELERLKDGKTREKIRNEITSQDPSGCYWREVAVASVQLKTNKWMEGKTLESIAGELRRQPVDALFDILIEERLRVGAIFYSMNQENLRKFLSLPYLMIGSDSSARSTGGPTHVGKPHPRGFGTFPRFLGRYARDAKLIDIGEAIRKMTALPASTFGLKGRGKVQEGYFADLVVFDENGIMDMATFEDPFVKAKGIHYVFVNGSPVIWDGDSTGKMPGRILRNGG